MGTDLPNSIIMHFYYKYSSLQKIVINKVKNCIILLFSLSDLMINQKKNKMVLESWTWGWHTQVMVIWGLVIIKIWKNNQEHLYMNLHLFNNSNNNSQL